MSWICRKVKGIDQLYESRSSLGKACLVCLSTGLLQLIFPEDVCLAVHRIENTEKKIIAGVINNNYCR